MMYMSKAKKIMLIGAVVLAFGIVLVMNLLPFSLNYSFSISGRDVSLSWLIVGAGAVTALFGFLFRNRLY